MGTKKIICKLLYRWSWQLLESVAYASRCDMEQHDRLSPSA